MKLTSRVILGLIVLCTSVLAPQLPAATAQSPSARAYQLAHEVTLGTFIKVKNRIPRYAIDQNFDWNSNGCSSPGWTGSVTNKWDPVFKRACDRHDFGYRNFGHGRAYNPTPAAKNAIDSQLLTDMRTLCSTYSGDRSDCRSKANLYYNAVHRYGSSTSWSKFTAKSCPKGWMCLFDDAGYADRRMVFKTTGENDMNDINFGDKTSSAWNNTSVAWVLYDDHDYKSRSLCFYAGAKVSNLDSYSFGDKTSSIRRRSDNTCP